MRVESVVFVVIRVLYRLSIMLFLGDSVFVCLVAMG